MAAALAGCATSDRDRDRDGGRSEANVLGDILGGVFGGGAGGSSLGRRITYRCEDDRRFTVSFDPFGQGASVDTGRRTYELRLDDSYRDRREYRDEDGNVRLQLEGDEAYLRVKDESDFQDCEAR